jgi:hypothetical protein
MTEEIRLVEAELAEATQRLDELREALADPSDLPSTPDKAEVIREFEDQQALVASLGVRLRELRAEAEAE